MAWFEPIENGNQITGTTYPSHHGLKIPRPSSNMDGIPLQNIAASQNPQSETNLDDFPEAPIPESEQDEDPTLRMIKNTQPSSDNNLQ